MEYKITEMNPIEKLNTIIRNSDSQTVQSVKCSNPMCSNPATVINFEVSGFSCKGKEHLGGNQYRDCPRHFAVEQLDEVKK
ncbi:hypothetical protein L1D51_21195 [Pseudoalteromonas shioyasakiensis]|uniref:hypothetical protein n=1 Tax=Pseudoalteromonas shioyasakiensis TaxID=1190813 RepID=UPI001EFE5778|nr:hypothetical protein [Pseudoalteromonas shioyasakiensis]MCG9736473.1 hypothetical protein [Pseudoalteromonas shioyasakiensis]